MSFDEEHIDPHAECAARIHELESALKELVRCNGLKALIDEDKATAEQIRDYNFHKPLAWKVARRIINNL